MQKTFADSFGSLWGSSISTPREKVIHYYQEHEELKCDPLYLAIKLGNLSLRYQRLLQQHKEEAEKLAKEGKTIRPLQGIKISFKEDSSIKITDPGPTQGLSRTLAGEGRLELGYIRPHLIKLLRWFDYKNSLHQKILKVCQQGIEAILKGYQSQQSQIINISQKPTFKQEKKEPQLLNHFMQEEKEGMKTIKVRAHTPETDFVIRILKNDRILLAEAIQEKDSRQEQEFREKLAQEEANYFPLHQLQLIKSAKTIDEYLAEKVKARWDNQTLTGIVKLFEAKPTDVFNHCDSLEVLIHSNPSAHEMLKNDIRDQINATLLNSTLSVQKDEE